VFFVVGSPTEQSVGATRLATQAQLGASPFEPSSKGKDSKITIGLNEFAFIPTGVKS
jgi:hypothetical protein